MMTRTAAVFGLALALSTEGTGATTRVEEHVRTRLTRLPIVLVEREPGGCEGLNAGAFRVREDGVAAGEVFLDPAPRDAAHAILIDVGPGMLSHLGVARWAATVYATALPVESATLLATVDHRLLLRTSWSSDRARFENEADWIEPGAASHLWRATRDLIRYLRVREGRKALILITRGCDTEGPGGVALDEVVTAAAGTDGLSVFPIAIDLPARCEIGGSDPLVSLGALAARTGGELFRVRTASDVDPVLAGIRRRLGQERELAWSPRPFGAGPKDKAKKAEARWRRIEVQVAGHPRCAVAIIGSSRRCEAAPGSSACLYESSRPPPPFSLTPDGRSLTGSVHDTVRDGGLVAPTLDDLLIGGAPPDVARPALVQDRAVSVWIPDAEDLIRPDASPEDVVFHALSRESRFGREGALALPASAPRGWTDTRILINGTTLLEVLDRLTRGLLALPDYRHWLEERVRRERLERLDRWIALEEGNERPSLVAARQAVASGPVTVDAGESVRFLGSWLGDLPAARVFRASEVWLARQLLTIVREGGPQWLAEAWPEVERLWAGVTMQVPEPRDVALLAWLVPGYDAAQRVIGYHRVVLAQPHSAELKDMIFNASPGDYLGATGVAEADPSDPLLDHFQSFNHSRDVPHGVRLVRWMLEQNPVAEILGEDFEVDVIGYAHSTDRDLFPALQRSGLAPGAARNTTVPARQVSLRLRLRNGNGSGLLIGAYFRSQPRSDPPTYEFEPICLVLFPDHALSEREGALLRALVDAPRRVSCIL